MNGPILEEDTEVVERGKEHFEKAPYKEQIGVTEDGRVADEITETTSKRPVQGEDI